MGKKKSDADSSTNKEVEKKKKPAIPDVEDATLSDSARLGFRLLQLRKQNGLKQQDLAKALGVHQSYISELEQGNRSFTYEILAKVAKHFDISLEYFDTRHKYGEVPLTHGTLRQQIQSLKDENEKLRKEVDQWKGKDDENRQIIQRLKEACNQSRFSVNELAMQDISPAMRGSLRRINAMLAMDEILDYRVIPALSEAQWSAEQIVRNARTGRDFWDCALRIDSEFVAAVEVKPDKSFFQSAYKQVARLAMNSSVKFVYVTDGTSISEYDVEKQTAKEINGFPSPQELEERLKGKGIAQGS